jgi:hypothetical protein
MGNPSKINPEKVANFSSPKSDRQLTSFYQQPTTNSPSKNHVLHPRFCQNTQQNGVNKHQKKLPQKRLTDHSRQAAFQYRSTKIVEQRGPTRFEILLH